MYRILLTLVFVFVLSKSFAQKTDSLFVWNANNQWVIKHQVKESENVFSIAHRYHVPPAALTGFNKISYEKELVVGSKLFIPLGAYNIVATKPALMNGYRPIYYRTGNETNINLAAKNTGVNIKTFLEWNYLKSNTVSPGQILLAGWILFDTSVYKRGAVAELISGNDGSPLNRTSDTLIVLSEGEKLFLAETNNGLNVNIEKGTAVFFPRAGKSSDGIYFAFHSTAKRGSIIKITNIGTEKSIYAKVIGPVPGTGHYYNALIGISDDAREELDVRDEKAFCEVSYGG